MRALDLDRFRSYLLLLARVRLDRKIQGKLDASDIVQQTLLQAHKNAAQFRGKSVQEYRAWLRSILANQIAESVRHLEADKRKIGSERSLPGELAESSARLEAILADDGDSPSEAAERNEHLKLLAEAMEDLPEDQRQVVVLRLSENGMRWVALAACPPVLNQHRACQSPCGHAASTTRHFRLDGLVRHLCMPIQGCITRNGESACGACPTKSLPSYHQPY